MLLEFTVGNYRSFRDKVTLSMLATHLAAKSPEVDERNVFVAPDGRRVLRAAVLYGANASGKSNFSRAMTTFWGTVQSSASGQLQDRLRVEPFLLDDRTATEPTHFEVVMVHEGVQYRYGFEATADQVTQEWLFHRPGRREVRLFERHGQDIRHGSTFAEGDRLPEKTRPNALFLSVAAQFNGPISTGILRASGSFGIYTIHGVTDHLLRTLTIEGLEDAGTFGSRIRELLAHADLGITSFRRDPTTPKRQWEEVDRDRSLEPRVLTKHRRRDRHGAWGEPVELSLNEHESDGTRKLFMLAGWIALMLERSSTLVIDELDARIHPLLTRAIVDLFLDPHQNPKNAQLIFATHDPGFLDPDLFRRDQIWFVEKDEDGASKLISLAEYKGVRADEAWRERYLAGRYGGTPILRRFGESSGG